MVGGGGAGDVACDVVGGDAGFGVGFVGVGAVFQAAAILIFSYNLVKSSGIPWVGTAFDPEYYNLPNQVGDIPAVPYGQAGNGAFALYKAANPSISKVAIIWVNTAGIQPFVNSEVAGWKSVGVNTVYNVGISGTASGNWSRKYAATSAGLSDRP